MKNKNQDKNSKNQNNNNKINKIYFLFIIPILIFIINENTLYYDNYIFLKPIIELTHLNNLEYEIYFDNDTIIGYEKVFSQKEIDSFIYCSFYDFESYIFENYDSKKVIIVGEFDNRNNSAKTNNKTNLIDFDFTDFSSYLMHNKFCITKDYLITGSTNPTYNGIYRNNNNLILFHFNNSFSFSLSSLLNISSKDIKNDINNINNINNKNIDISDNMYQNNNSNNKDLSNINIENIKTKIKQTIHKILNIKIQPVKNIQFLYIKNFIATIKNQTYSNELKKIKYSNINITPCFSPFDDCQALIINELKKTNKSQLLTFSFTDKNIFYNLNYADIVIEKSNRNKYTIDKFDIKKSIFLDELFQPKIKIYNDNNKYNMHNKVFILEKSIITGSYNPTGNAQKNHENILIIENDDLRKEFQNYFLSIYNQSIPI